MDVWADPTWPTPACAFCYLRFLSIFRWLSNLFREVECSARLSLASDPNGTCSERHLSIVLQIPGAPTLDEHSVNSAPEKSFVWLCSNSSHSVNAQSCALTLLPYSLVPPYQPKSRFQVGVRKNRNTLHGCAISQRSQIQTPFNIAKNVLNQNKRWNSICMQSVQNGWTL